MAEPRRDRAAPENSPDPAERVTARNYPNWIWIAVFGVVVLLLILWFASR